MFTGIVEEVGRFTAAEQNGVSTRLKFSAELAAHGLSVGESIAVNGCCLTVVAHRRGGFDADAIAETLSRTNLGALRPGDPVNLERSLEVGDRLGGHLVQGHVDAVGTILEAAPHLFVAVPERLEPYLVEKGSIAIDGCSLTLVDVGPERVHVEIIPHTAAVTTLGDRPRGAAVNIEVDVVARYVERLVRAGTPSPYDAVGRRR